MYRYSLFQRCLNSGLQNFIPFRGIFVSLQFGTCFISPFWRLAFWVCYRTSTKICVPLCCLFLNTACRVLFRFSLLPVDSLPSAEWCHTPVACMRQCAYRALLHRFFPYFFHSLTLCDVRSWGIIDKSAVCRTDVYDFRLPPKCKWDLRPSAMLHNVGSYG